MSKPLITIKNLKISKSDKILLDNLNFTIHQNDRIILVGENGSGKTSLMKIIKGIEEADSGTIWKKPNLKIDYLDQNPLRPNLIISRIFYHKILNIQICQKQKILSIS